MLKKTISIGVVSLFAIGGLVGIIFLIPDEVEAPGPTYVNGVISENTTWTVEDSPFIVTDNILVENGVTLTIKPGVVVKFDEYVLDRYYMIIEGQLNANGTEDKMITFTSNKTSPTPDDWDKIEFSGSGGANNNIINYCKIEYSMNGICMVGSSPISITNNVIHYNQIGIESSNTISSAIISGNKIFANNYGIRVNSGTFIIEKNLIFDNNIVGIYTEGESNITSNNIWNNTLGIHCNEQSPSNLSYNNIYDNIDYNIKGAYPNVDVMAKYNWWGTTDTDLINQSIYDYYDDFNLGKVIYDPFLIEPSPYAPELLFKSGLQEGAPWPMFHYDEKHSGLSPFDTSSNNGELKWSFQTGGIVLSSPAINSEGTIYVGSGDNNFYAINPNGTEKWSFPTGGRVISSPAIGSDGTIYVGSEDDKLYAINPDGSEKWSFITGNDVKKAPVIGSDGTIFIGSNDNKLYAIYPNGTEKWSFTAGAPIGSSPAIDSSGIIYFHSEENKLYAIYPNGLEKWNYVLGAFWSGHPSPSIDSDDTIYIASDNNNLYAIYPNGTKKWNFTLHGVAELAPAIDSDGTIYVGSDNYYGLIDKLYAINPDGTEKWNTYITGSPVFSSPSVDSNGIIYIGSGGKLYSIYPNSTERWYFESGGQVDSSPAIGSDGTIYVGSSDGNLYAIGTTSSNQPPTIPPIPSGPTSGLTNISYSFSTSTSDPEGDQIKYGWDWDGDGTVDEWSSLVDSGTEDNRSHSWSKAGIYNISVKAIDEFGAESGSSDPLTVTITVEVVESDIEITGITLSKYGPSAGEVVTIYAEIQNNGNNDSSVLVRFYDGDPSIGGTQIGDNQTVSIPSGSSVIISVEWTAIVGNHDLYVIAEDLVSGKETIAYLSVEVGEGISPILVLTTGDINIYRFEPSQERTISVEVTCYLQTVNNVHLIVLDDQNLTIDHTITPAITMTNGETTKFYLRIKAPQLPEGVEKLEKDILIQAVGDNGIFSNAEELDIVVSQDAVSFLNPITIAGAVVTGSLATLGAAAAASRRNENWKYLLLLTFAVPLYTRIHGKKTLDNFVRGQVYGHIQSKPGTHFNEIRKTLKLGNGNLAYHLRKLEKEGFIISKRDKRFRRFYPVGVEVPEEDGIKLSKTQEIILDFIERHPKSNQKEIAKSLKESQQTISYNINVLVREGFLKEEKIEGTKTYEIFDENT